MSPSHRPPRVSVLMTVLNAHPVYFPRAVRSILTQTFSDFELLVVEDPSSSPAGSLLRELGDPRIRHHVNPQRTSLVEQKNQGLAAARGDLVALFDADDIAEPERLEKQVRFLELHKEVVVLGSQIRIIDAAGRPRGYRAFPLHHEDILRAFPSLVPLSQPGVTLRKGPVLEAGGYGFREYPVAEDYELWSRLARRGLRFANHPEALLRYRVHPGQMKCTHLRQTIRAILHVKRLYWHPHVDRLARLRTWLEWAMLALPPRLVHRLFALTQHRRCLPPARRAAPGNSPVACRVQPATNGPPVAAHPPSGTAFPTPGPRWTRPEFLLSSGVLHPSHR
jgi:glycosyltransferase involved in cell wall biosynthesis